MFHRFFAEMIAVFVITAFKTAERSTVGLTFSHHRFKMNERLEEFISLMSHTHTHTYIILMLSCLVVI